MIRKIIPIAAAALGIGMLTVAPPVAEAALTAVVNVSVIADPTTSISATSAAIKSWTGAALQVPFTVTVTTSDAKVL